MWIFFTLIFGVFIVGSIIVEENKLFPPEAEPFKALVLSAALSAGVPWEMMAAEIGQESGWDPSIVNPASGATGIAQFEPATAAQLGVDPLDPQSAIPGMAGYLASLHRELSDQGYPQWSYALAAYDWGIGNVLHALNAGMPPNTWPQETRHYVSVITSRSGIDQNTAALFA